MLCNLCGKNDATIHLTEIINAQMLELHICESCGNEKEGLIKNKFSFHELLAGLADISSLGSLEKKSVPQCRSCGLTYEEFGKAGRLGCPDCYAAFSKALTQLIKRVQKGAYHIGKKPAKFSKNKEIKKNELHDFKKLLEASVRNEEYEDAARLRDIIKKMEAASTEKKTSKAAAPKSKGTGEEK